jgi:hypothetical protein
MSDTSTATAATGTATAATTASATDPTGTTATATDGTGAATAASTAATQTAPTVEQLQADVEKWKALSRKNEQAAKAKGENDAAQKKLLAEVAAKLGIANADGQPDPAQITAQLETAQREMKSRTTELAVLRAAGRLGADGDALLDSRAFMAQLDGLDGTEAIEAAIKLAVAQSPARYGRGTAQAAATDTGTAAGNGAGTTASAGASTAGGFAGSPGGNRQWTEQDVSNASPAEVTKAMEQGLLKNLLGSR